MRAQARGRGHARGRGQDIGVGGMYEALNENVDPPARGQRRPREGEDEEDDAGRNPMMQF